MIGAFDIKLAELESNYQAMKNSLAHVTDAHQLECLAQEQIEQKQANLAQQSQNGRLALLQRLAKQQEDYLQEMQNILSDLDSQASEEQDLIAEYYLDLAELTFWQATYVVARQLA